MLGELERGSPESQGFRHRQVVWEIPKEGAILSVKRHLSYK
jgi:hypothetical protein